MRKALAGSSCRGRAPKPYLGPAVLCLTLWALPALASRGDPTSQLAEEHAAAAARLAGSPRAAAHLLRLGALRDGLADLTVVQQAAERVLERREPFSRAVAVRLLADLYRARGHLNKAHELSQPLGFLDDFYVVGSFDNEGKQGCGVDPGPEKAQQLSTTYPAKDRELSWRRLSGTGPDGYVDLGAALRPNREAVGYALTFLQAPAAGKLALGVGASGAFRLWVNGQQVLAEDHYNLPRFDQARVLVTVRKGLNRVLLKVCNASGPFGFYLRQERGGGAGPLQVILPESVPALERGPGAEPKRLPTLTSELERLVRAQPKDAALRAEYATVLAFGRAFDQTTHLDTAEAERAAAAAPKDRLIQLVAADAHAEDGNARRGYLEAALRATPGHAFTRFLLAEHDLSHGHAHRAQAVLVELVRAHPTFGAARVALARAHDALEEWPGAVTLMETAVRDLPQHPAVSREGASVAARLDRPSDAITRLRVVLSQRYDDTGSRRLLANLLADLTRIDEAAAQLEVVLKLDPFDNSTRVRLAELHAANDRLALARKLFQEAKALSPDDPELHEREGRALLQAGHRDEALRAFERSLTLRPQNPALKEALRALKGESGGLGTQYALDVRKLAGEAARYANEDVVKLVDYSYVRVQPSGLSSRFHQVGVKVFTARGVEAFRSFPISYAPTRQEIRVLKARVTKPDGSVVESFGESERNLNEPWSGMYYDARAKVLSFPALSPGDVLELQYHLEDTAQDNLLSDYWGDVDYVQGTHPTLRYQYLVEMPEGRPLYWNRARLGSAVQAAQEKLPAGRMLYRWTAQDVPKVTPEPGMPGWAEVVTTLHVSTYQSWEQVGRYYWGLVRDQLAPNDEIRKTVDKVLAGVKRADEASVVRAIYNFVVTNTRYVALEFGIHGYKPYRVDRVLARRFGDCKDKASLIHAMLKVAGVDSRLVLLRMRHLGNIGAEPASLAAFNHAIVYVPKLQLFLDGTAEFHGARELPSADRVANVLIVEPDGSSTFLTTPEARAEDNLSTLVLNVALKPDGSAELSGQTQVAGTQAPEYRRTYQSAATRKTTFEQGWAQTFPGLVVQQVSLNDVGKLDEAVAMTYRMRVPRFAEAAPAQLRFFPFASGRSYAQSLAPLAQRQFDLVMNTPWSNRFTFRHTLPPGFTFGEPPKDVLEETPFGRIRLTHRLEGNTLLCEGEVALTAARIRAQDYPAFRAFLARVDQAFARKVTAAAGTQAASAGQTP